jgi:hypothetical protein
MSHNYRDGGKGDKPRPFSVDLEKFAENFDLIFNKEKQNGNKDGKKSTDTSTKEKNNR